MPHLPSLRCLVQLQTASRCSCLPSPKGEGNFLPWMEHSRNQHFMNALGKDTGKSRQAAETFPYNTLLTSVASITILVSKLIKTPTSSLPRCPCQSPDFPLQGFTFSWIEMLQKFYPSNGWQTFLFLSPDSVSGHVMSLALPWLNSRCRSEVQIIGYDHRSSSNN